MLAPVAAFPGRYAHAGNQSVRRPRHIFAGFEYQGIVALFSQNILRKRRSKCRETFIDCCELDLVGFVEIRA